MPEPHDSDDQSDDDDDRTIGLVRCLRVDDHCDHSANAYVDKCYACGAAIWVGNETPAMILKRADEMRAYCMTCPTPDFGELVIPPEQIDELRAMGVPDFDIVCALALAMVSGEMMDLDAAMTRVMAAGLDSEIGVKFLKAIGEMARLMRMHDGRN